MSGFEPPAYISSLIESINDGAKAAQTGGLFLLAIAVYLMATVISTTDEVLLRGTFVEFSQIGVKVPLVASYTLAPIVFVFLHVHTLIRYDRVAEGLLALVREIDLSVPKASDRERCLQLLTNVEFVQFLISPPRSRWLHGIFVHSTLVWIPLLVLVATQISFLRYQDALTTWVVHFACLLIDLSILSIFTYRWRRRKQWWRDVGKVNTAKTLILSVLHFVTIFVIAIIYFVIAPIYSITTGKKAEFYFNTLVYWDGLVRGYLRILANYQPLDIAACPQLGWGCRYLQLSKRLLLAEKPEGEVLFKLRLGEGGLNKLLLRVEGLFLRQRSFRFADFSQSEFYDADFAGADLRLANLDSAVLAGANLSGANLQGAYLGDAKLQGAGLFFAKMQGANLGGAKLQGANLTFANLQGADLGGANLQGADLGGANLQGADLGGANLQGAGLGGAELQGADLQHTRLWQAHFDQDSNFSLADLRGIDLKPVSSDELTNLLHSLDAIPERRRQETIDKLTTALTLATPPMLPASVRVETGKPVLIEAELPNFADFGTGLTTNEWAHDAALAPFLAGLARGDTNVARGIARRVTSNPDAKRRLWPDLARRLLAAEKDGAFQLDLSPDNRKALESLAAKAPSPLTGKRTYHRLPAPRPRKDGLQ